MRELGGGIGGDQIVPGLLGGGARQVSIGPYEPVTNPLMRSQFGICSGNSAGGSIGSIVRTLVFQHQYGTGLSISGTFYANYNAISYVWNGAQSSFEVFGIDVQSLGSDDYVLLSALKVQIAGLIDGAQIPGAKPFAFASRDRFSVHPVGLSHTVAAH